MKTLKEYLNKFKKDCEKLDKDYENVYPIIDAYKQGFIDATKLAAENGTVTIANAIRFVDKQSILKAIEE